MKILREIFSSWRDSQKPRVDVTIVDTPEADVCEHDWEVVEYGDLCRWRGNYGGDDGGEWHYCADIPIFVLESLYCETELAKNRVCLLCGECDDGIGRFSEMLKLEQRRDAEIKKAARRRKLLAKQMWADGCKGEK